MNAQFIIPEDLPITAMVDVYNQGQHLLGRDDHVAKFRDRKTGESRLGKLHEELVKMHGHAQLTMDPEEQKASWTLTVPEKEEGATHHSTLPLEKEIMVLATGNPKRVGTRSHDTFNIYYKAGVVTGEDYVAAMIEAGYTRRLAMSSLHWDLDKGYISFGGAALSEGSAVDEIKAA